LRHVLPNELKRDLAARYRSATESARKRLEERRAEARQRIAAESIAQGVYPSDTLVTHLAGDLQNSSPSSTSGEP
jgi:ribosomal protein L34